MLYSLYITHTYILLGSDAGFTYLLWRYHAVPISHLLVREVHPLKASCPICVTNEGISTEVRKVHPLKAPCPICVTDEGISTEVRDVHP